MTPSKERAKRIFSALKEKPEAIVFLNSVEPHMDLSFFYATGLSTGLFEDCAFVLSPNEFGELVTSALEEETAKWSGLPIHTFTTIDQRDEHLRRLLKGKKKIGVNKFELTARAFEDLKTLAPKAKFIDISEALVKVRLVKDKEEIELLQKACDIASRAFDELAYLIGKGSSEHDVAAELVYQMQRRGAEAPSFTTIVASGPRSAEPHYTRGERRLKLGDLVIVDFGARYKGYCSDITRTMVVGKPSEEQRTVYSIVAKAQAAALRKMKVGVRGSSVDAAARNLIDRTKYKGRFVHSLGHSIGMAVHDGVRLNRTSNITLRAGMAFTNEPGIYVPGWGGVRIEDDVLITRSGPQVMTTARRELVQI